MTWDNARLYREFARGATGGQSNRMEIKRVSDLDRDNPDDLPDDATVVVGYGWAVYAARLPSGQVVVYEGWDEWANETGKRAEATPRHINGLASYADAFSDKKPEAADPPKQLIDRLENGRRESGFSSMW